MKKTERKRKLKIPTINAIDLFCGAGGLTKGLEKAGINVRLGIDIDPDCAYPYEANNNAKFLLTSVEKLKGKEITASLLNSNNSSLKLLAGCAPCQPFSKYSQGGAANPRDKRWNLLREFTRLIKEVSPELVTMENVPGLAQQKIFKEFIQSMEKNGFYVSYKVVNCADYGVPQKRNRLVLLASKLGPIELISPTHKPENYKTVKDTIGKLPKIKAGETDGKDSLHQAASLSPLNFKRIKVSRPGGSWRDWNSDLIAKCHKKKSGRTYQSVYGRMSWDEPSPTMTTQYFGFGNGRFGHPTQNRAISLREGALLQSFPRNYKFISAKGCVSFGSLGRIIGNAVPVRLGEIIGKSIFRHVSGMKHVNKNKRTTVEKSSLKSKAVKEGQY
jgi:DNA (cytosine-5)-methyltransferase 1